MATLLQTVGKWFGWGGALSETSGEQLGLPSNTLVDGTANIGPDGALQLDAVWACIELRANTIASLPFFAYTTKDGEKTLDRNSRLYSLLHESPNNRMSPFEFWRAMMVNHDLRGNAYARLDRIGGEVVAMWPMPADQVRPFVLDDGSMAYEYAVEGGVAVLAEENVLHLKNMGNGTIGLAKLDFMRGTTDEQAKAQGAAAKVFGNAGKPTAVLMIDSALTQAQRESLRTNYAELATGSTQRLAVLEANMKYQQLSISPEDQQLLETRRFGVEQIGRWFGVPAVLINHPGVVQYGNHDIIEGFFHKLTIRPMVVNIEQAVRKRILSPRQRVTMSVEFSMDALLRGSASQRADLYSKYAQNGIMTRQEIRQLEGWPKIEGTDQLTAQSNLVPLNLLGKTPAPAKDVPTEPVLQSAYLTEMSTKTQDQRHLELLSAIKADSKSGITIDMGKALFTVTHEAPPAPVVQVSNFVNPTPVSVQVMNDVAPTPVEVMANFEATIQPATVELSMPTRRTEGTVTRNDKGEIVKTVTTEVSV